FEAGGEGRLRTVAQAPERIPHSAGHPQHRAGIAVYSAAAFRVVRAAHLSDERHSYYTHKEWTSTKGPGRLFTRFPVLCADVETLIA
ncbi:hypothetical protein, partial [Mesorhizobium sp. M1A.T.Ca.IN.004.03.1.1]|uniref:hypothetical protein n=1 Tax=Mesorhizobium sp. M1A.T.Ca.IN.004.03.1.1 TaxID=2496795 RepID=UPI0019D1FF14